MTLRKSGLLLAFVLLAAGVGGGPAAANKEAAPQAAFVRGGDLWVKEGAAERRLTNGQTASFPKWSATGRWLAYAAGEDGRQLRIVDLAKGEERPVSRTAGNRFEWAPALNRLAYRDGNRLVWIDAARPDQPFTAAGGIGNFSWLPDGSGFVASTEAELRPDGSWTRVRILHIPLSAQGDSARFQTLYELPARSDDFFAVGTSAFKWSADGRWMAFLAKPTASLSADRNTLCVLSADGSSFQIVDRMAFGEQGFAWSERGNRLAYVAGEGREATVNKRLEAAAVPLGRPVSYTPSGFVDQHPVWKGERILVVARAREQKSWTADPAERPFPYLAEVALRSGRERKLTAPSSAHGDYAPVFLPASKALAWVRSDRRSADVMLAAADGRSPRVWIRGLDLGPNFYEQWDWSAVWQVNETGGKAGR